MLVDTHWRSYTFLEEIEVWVDGGGRGEEKERVEGRHEIKEKFN